jgi:hypothetical protein
MSEPTQVPAVTQHRSDSPSKFSIYCNNTELALSPWDVRIKIMEMLGAEGGVVELIVHGSLAMSPQHAKAFSEALQKTIQIYEDNFGPIDISRSQDQVKVNPVP